MATTASLLLLSSPFFGIQSVWSTEMAFAPPYLLSLGMPRDFMSLVLLAAPLSGLVVQPLIGHYADHSRSRYGKRRPFMFWGSLIAGFAMLLLGYGKPWMNKLFGTGSTAAAAFTIVLAIISVFVVDFSVNAVMAVDRALLVDVLGPDEQERANAWASRMVQFGQIIGYWIGSLHLPSLLPWLGTTQIQIISAITIISLLVPHMLVIHKVKEKPSPEPLAGRPSLSFLEMLKGLIRTARALPTVVHKAFAMQFWCWLSQFPTFIYTTVYIGDIYRSLNDDVDPEAPTRLGSRALFYQGLVGLFCITALPMLVKPQVLRKIGLWRRESPPNAVLCALWTVSQAVSAFVLIGLSMSTTVHGATILIALNGFCVTVNHWAPFSLVGEAILLSARSKEMRDDDGYQTHEDGAESPLLDQPPSQNEPVSAGAAMGILNTFIVIPQFAVIGLSSILFAILEPDRTITKHHATTSLRDSQLESTAPKDQRSITLIIIFRLAAVSGLIAMYLGIQLTQLYHSQASIRPPSRTRIPSRDGSDDEGSNEVDV